MIEKTQILPRFAGSAVLNAAKDFPVVVLLGARQTGKTTLLRSMPELASRPYLTLDDFDLRTQAESNPESVVDLAPMLVLDEVQRARDLLIAIKRAVDDDAGRTPGRFILTGSANFLMMERIAETLAGRAVYITLWPFTRRERLGLGEHGIWKGLLESSFEQWPEVLQGQDPKPEEWTHAVKLGGFPSPSYGLREEHSRELWYAGYVQTYLERDLQALRAVENLADFRRLMRAASLRVGGLLNQTELGRDTGISQPQVHRFLNLMEASYQAIRLPAFSVNRTSRLIKAPKLYSADTGLAMYLAGESIPRGAHLENYILLDLLAWRDVQSRRPEILYWRTATGEEVDFVIETPDRLLPVEVKATSRVTSSDARGLVAFLREYSDLAMGGLLLYAGTKTIRLAKGVLAVPWWQVC